MIAGFRNVRWINTQEGIASFIREVKIGRGEGVHQRIEGVLRKGTGC